MQFCTARISSSASGSLTRSIQRGSRMTGHVESSITESPLFQFQRLPQAYALACLTIFAFTSFRST